VGCLPVRIRGKSTPKVHQKGRKVAIKLPFGAEKPYILGMIGAAWNSALGRNKRATKGRQK
jgi:hypothetical protein